MTEHPAAAPITPVDAVPRALQTSAWILYSLIVLEILFMVSPLAAYYYAVYAAPLNALAASPRTSWLTQQVLPHFSYSASPLVNGLLLIAWPLILVGLTLFLWGCARVYYAKLTRRGPVTGGLYRYVRHPQYLALAIVGLGTTLYWSRFLVLLAYVTMLWLYGALARFEERRCLARFGSAYGDYLEHTGRFLPRSIESIWHRLTGPLTALRPRRGRVVQDILLFAACLMATVWAGHALRQHALGSLTVEVAGPHLVLFLAPLAPGDRVAVARLVANAAGDTPRLAYVAPARWTVPELGLEGSDEGLPPITGELRHPASHGNAGGFDRGRIHVLVAAPGPVDPAARGLELLSAAVRIEPEVRLSVDLDSARITGREPAPAGRWQHIPVPAF